MKFRENRVKPRRYFNSKVADLGQKNKQKSWVVPVWNSSLPDYLL